MAKGMMERVVGKGGGKLFEEKTPVSVLEARKISFVGLQNLSEFLLIFLGEEPPTDGRR